MSCGRLRGQPGPSSDKQSRSRRCEAAGLPSQGAGQHPGSRQGPGAPESAWARGPGDGHGPFHTEVQARRCVWRAAQTDQQKPSVQADEWVKNILSSGQPFKAELVCMAVGFPVPLASPRNDQLCWPSEVDWSTSYPLPTTPSLSSPYTCGLSFNCSRTSSPNTSAL